MKNKLLYCVITIGLFLLMHSSLEAILFLDRHRWYVSGGGSWDWYTNNKVRLDGVPGENRPDTSWGVMAALGYYLNQWRIELEGAYRDDEGNDIFFSDGIETVRHFDHVARFSVMANAYYDVPICYGWGFYLGGGLGAGFTRLELDGLVGDERDRVRFAYQLMVGGFWDISGCATITFGYRLFGISTPTDFERTVGATTVLVETRSVPLNQSVEVGLRITL